MTLEDQIALVTGASRGIGQAIALKLGSLGANVVGTATSDKGAASIQANFDANKLQGLGLCLDVTQQTSIDAAMGMIKERFGVPTILVNNAGITRDNLLMRMKDDEWYDVVDTNLNSLYRLSKGVLRGMTKARRGRIINIASVVGSTGNAGQTNYAAAKAGIEGFTRSLARELASRAISVNCIAPGLVETPMTASMPEKTRRGLLANIPLGRPGRPDEVAQAVLDLCGNNVREKSMPSISGLLTTIMYLFPGLARALRPTFERKGARTKARLKKERAARQEG